jgi:hypothetical protein
VEHLHDVALGLEITVTYFVVVVVVVVIIIIINLTHNPEE